MRSRLGVWAGALLIASAVGCGLPKMDEGLDDISMEDLEVVEDHINRALRALFPDLSEDELAEISVSLDLDDVLALREELEAIRESVEEFSAALFTTAEERVEARREDLADHNDGFPEGLGSIGQLCRYDASAEHAQISLSGVLNGQDSVLLTEDMITLTVDGQEQDFTLSCLPNGPTVDIVFLIDITGSMSNVIDSVRDSVVDFVDIIESSGLTGTISVVSFQDTVGVNRTFQETAPPNDYERSPFFAPVAIESAGEIAELRSFVNRLEANRGADAPENLAGAIDFARNSVIGYETGGAPNVIGDGRQDPAGTAAFPRLRSERQVFVVLTDVTFHGDDRDSRSSSLEAAFVPRDAADILATLHRTGTVVHVSDPSWSDGSLSPTSASVDADYWAVHTGGVGEDIASGYSLVDLELVVVAEGTGLLDITLDKILSSSCTLDLDVQLAANAQIALELNVEDLSFSTDLQVVRF
jgi:hypothetical protein